MSHVTLDIIGAEEQVLEEVEDGNDDDNDDDDNQRNIDKNKK